MPHTWCLFIAYDEMYSVFALGNPLSIIARGKPLFVFLGHQPDLNQHAILTNTVFATKSMYQTNAATKYCKGLYLTETDS